VSGYRADEDRVAGIVVERAAQDAYRLVKRIVRDHDVAPGRIEDFTARDRFAASFQEQDEQVEIARDERVLDSVP
jgi:hypothetical protein